jgi:hypothetical protein
MMQAGNHRTPYIPKQTPSLSSYQQKSILRTEINTAGDAAHVADTTDQVRPAAAGTTNVPAVTVVSIMLGFDM